MEGISELVDLKLRNEKRTSEDVDLSKCIICQKHRKEKTSTTKEGRERILIAAEIRQDDVLSRINLLEKDSAFVYHCSNSCYKSYTLKKTLLGVKKKHESKQPNESDDTLLQDSTETPTKKLRGDSSLRSKPSPKISPATLPCIVCGKLKHNNIIEKYRISETTRAKTFLAATLFFLDDVYTRTCDLHDESAVFGADIYYHKLCLEAYLQRYRKQSEQHVKTPKQNKSKIIEDIQPVLQDILDRGYGVSLSEIRDYCNQQCAEQCLANKEVKLYLINLFGDNIQFSKSPQKNQSQLVYSSNLTLDQVANKLRSVDFIKETAKIIRQSLLETDFSLDDEFGDAKQLEESWETTPIPHPLIEFLCELLNVTWFSVWAWLAYVQSQGYI